MSIVAIHTRRIDLPLSDTQWRFVRGAIASIAGYVVEVVDDQGRKGHGYFRTMPPATLPLASLKAAFDDLSAVVIGADARGIHAIMDSLDAHQEGVPALKAAIECALYDLLARTVYLPLHDLYGGRRHERFPCTRIVPLKTPEAMADVAGALAKDGFGFLKIKMSGDESLDVARVQAVRSAVGPGVRLMVDANESYQPKSAIRMVFKVLDYGVELVEQPTPGHDLAGLAQVTRAVPIPVEADESAPDLQSIYRIAEMRAAESISLRIMNLGGITNTLRAVALCEAAGLNYRFGAIFGSRVMHAHTLHLASTLRAPAFAHEFSEFSLFLDDPFDGLVLERGTVGLPSGPGTGVHLRDAIVS
ncbi:MAG: enolase C-terminal domain-like protein [Burkholderiaceae bacterium]